MTERVRSATGYHGPKMENDLSPRKTLMVLVIVVGCFAVLWPKVFYPMLVGSANQHIKPSPIDKTTGCCDVISETDVNTIKIMSELCGTIIKSTEEKPLSGKEIVQRCRQEVLETCGIDISVVLQEQVRLGQSVKQILDEVRSLNGSLCLKYNFGVAPWRLGVPHRITVKTASDVPNIRQERPLHLRSELVHPAFRERGRAIPQPQIAPPSRPPPRVVEGRPGPVPGMRPTLGGAGHVVPPSKQGTSSMSVIMPIYTIGIVIFFTYTLMRIIFKKQPEGVGGSLYPPVEPDPHFRKEVFESEASRLSSRLTRENISTKLVVNAMSALLDEVDQEIEARRKSSEVASQDLANGGTLSNGDVPKPQENEEQPTVKVLGMETTASCEGGKKWSRPDSPVPPTSPPPQPVPPPQEIYLEGALPAQSHLLVADSAIEPEPTTGEDPAVVLSGKMTLSVISLDSENGGEEAVDKAAPVEEPVIECVAKLKEEIAEAIRDETNEIVGVAPIGRDAGPEESVEEVAKVDENEEEFEIEEYVLEPIIIKRFEAAPASRIEVEDIEKKLQESSRSALIVEEKVEDVIRKPLIQLDSEETPHSVEVEELEKEVDELIQEAIESIEHKQPINLELLQTLNLETNELNDNLQNLEEQIENEERREEIVPQKEESKLDLQILSEKEQSKGDKLTLPEKEESKESTPTPQVAIEKEEPKEEGKPTSQVFPENEQSKEDKLTLQVLPEKEEGKESKSTPPAAIEKEENQLILQVLPEKAQSKEDKPTSQVLLEKEESKESKPTPQAAIEKEETKEESKPISQVLPEKEQSEGSKSTSQVLSEKEESKENKQISQVVLEKQEDKPTLQVVSDKQEIKEEEKPISQILLDVLEQAKLMTEEPKPDAIKENISIKDDEVENIIDRAKDVSIIEQKPEGHEVSNEELKEKSSEDLILQKIEEKTKPVSENIEDSSSINVEKKASLDETVKEATKEKSEEKPKPDAKATIEETTKEEVVKSASKDIEEKLKEIITSKDTEISRKDIQEPPKISSKEPPTPEKIIEIEPSSRVEEQIEKTKVDTVESAKPSSPILEKVEEKAAKPSHKEIEEKTKPSEPVEIVDDDELGSEEEIVEEIEEIVYESNEEGSEEEEEEEEESEEVEIERNTNRTDSGAVQKVNGERSEDFAEESKYTTVSGATAAENDISDEELTDNEEVDEEEEIIEVEEEIEDDDYIVEEGNDVNHVSGESEPEL